MALLDKEDKMPSMEFPSGKPSICRQEGRHLHLFTKCCETTTKILPAEKKLEIQRALVSLGKYLNFKANFPGFRQFMAGKTIAGNNYKLQCVTRLSNSA